MDYRIRRSKAELNSTGYLEIGPGKYSGKHWQERFLFVCEDAFRMAEGIVAKHVPDYDHFAPNDIPKNLGIGITSEWRDVAARLETMSAEQAFAALHLHACFRDRLKKDLEGQRAEIAEMLRTLADECDTFYQQGDWMCVLGM